MKQKSWCNLCKSKNEKRYEHSFVKKSPSLELLCSVCGHAKAYHHKEASQ